MPGTNYIIKTVPSGFKTFIFVKTSQLLQDRAWLRKPSLLHLLQPSHIYIYTAVGLCFSARQWFADLLTVSEGFNGWEEEVEKWSCTWCKLGFLQLQGWQSPAGWVSLFPLCWGHELWVCWRWGLALGSQLPVKLLCSCSNWVCFQPGICLCLHCSRISEPSSKALFFAAKAHAVPQLHWSLNP